MMHRLAAAVALAAALSPCAGRAEGFITGSQLMSACTGSGPLNDRQCVGYIAGAADQVSANPSLKGVLCPLPAGTELKDVKAVLVRYGNEHKDKVGGPAIVLLNEAIKDRYPCK
jgi:hypothetical protein